MIFINARCQLLTNAKEAREYEPLPPPVGEPQGRSEHPHLPRRVHRHSAVKSGLREAINVGGKRKHGRAKHEIAEDKASGPQRIFLEEIFGDSVAYLLHCDFGWHKGSRQPENAGECDSPA